LTVPNIHKFSQQNTTSPFITDVPENDNYPIDNLTEDAMFNQDKMLKLAYSTKDEFNPLTIEKLGIGKDVKKLL